MSKPWSNQDVHCAVEILKRSATVPEACETLAGILGRPVDVSNLRAVFSRRGMAAPKDLVKGPAEAPAAPIDPLGRARETAQQKRLKAEHKHLVELAQECEARDAVRSALAAAEPPPIVRREFGSGLREGTLVVMASDLHVEEMVVPSSSTFNNAYSLEIADLRMSRLFGAMKWQLGFKREAFRIRSAVFGIGGDTLTGHLHDENVETGQLSQVETLLWLKPRFIAGIDSLLEDPELEEIYVPCSYGNHGRNTKKPMRARGSQHSYEWLMYQDLAHHYRHESRVRFLANPSGHQYHKIYDFTRHQHHGDEVRYGGGVGGIMVPLSKAIFRWNAVRYADFHDVGHFHQYFQTPNLGANGSGIGYNDYAMSIGAGPEPAQQLCYMIDSKRAKCEMTPLWLVDYEAENALRVARGWAPWPEEMVR